MVGTLGRQSTKGAWADNFFVPFFVVKPCFPKHTGKTTLLRDIARILSTPPEQGGLGLAVLVVDTSNEICGKALSQEICLITMGW